MPTKKRSKRRNIKMLKKTKKKISVSKKNPYQKTLEQMKKNIHICYKKLKNSIDKKEPLSTIKKYIQEMRVLLGETNFLEKECERLNKEK